MKKLCFLIFLLFITMLTTVSCGNESGENGNGPKPHVHAFGDWYVSKEATCAEEGEEKRVCACGESETRPISKIEHTPGDSVTENLVDSTCEKEGSYDEVVRCTECDEELSRTEKALERKQHEYVDGFCTACGAEKLMSEGLKYTLSEDETYYIVSGIGTCTDTDILIPSSFNNIPVTVIGDWAFNSKNITSVRIPDSIIHIGDNAFSSCTSLTSIIIPDSVTSIGMDAFRFCSSLTSVTISSGLTSISANMFDCCMSLESVTIPNGVTTIEYYAFCGCTGLKSIVIPESVTTIRAGAFSSCTSLEELYFNAVAVNDFGNEDDVFAGVGAKGDGIKVVIGKNVTKIPERMFGTPNVSSAVTKIVSVEFEGTACESIGASAFYACTLQSITIPDSVKTIGYNAFSYCTTLKSVTIGRGVVTIGTSAFTNCTALEEIYFNAVEMNDLINTESYVFFEAGKDGNGIKVVIGKNVTKIPAFLFYANVNAPKIISVEFEEGSECVCIGASAFYYCKSLISVTVPKFVTDIGRDAFGSCTSLTSIKYYGTEEAWEAIEKGYLWNYYTGNYTITYNYKGEE